MSQPVSIPMVTYRFFAPRGGADRTTAAITAASGQLGPGAAEHAPDGAESNFPTADDIQIAAAEPMKRLCTLGEDLGLGL